MPKGQTRIDGLDDKRVGLHAGGLTVRDIQAHLLDLYGLKVSPDLIGRVSDAVLDEVREWQCRAPDRMCPVEIFDALRVKFRDAASRTVKNKAVDVTLGVTREGPGLWIAEIAEAESDAFEETWAGKYASIRCSLRLIRRINRFTLQLRKIISTTNATESLNRVIRKTIKRRGSFATDEAATKPIYLAIRKFEKDGRNVREWFAARDQSAMMFGERFD